MAALAIVSALGAPSLSRAQAVDPAVRDAYFRAASDYFHVPMQEVTIISGWGMNPDEVPVVLFLAQRAGVSPDALIGVRRGGRPWMEVASRFGVGASVFHIPLPQDADLGPLTRACGEFSRRPAGEWGQIRLEDLEVVALVNVRVLAEQTESTPVRVLEALGEAGTFVAAYPLLIRR